MDESWSKIRILLGVKKKEWMLGRQSTPTQNKPQGLVAT